METKKQAKKQARPLEVAILPVVMLDDKKMSAVSGGGVLMSD